MSRYISKNVLLLTFIVLICCGLYPLSQRLIARGMFPFEANSDMLSGPDSKVGGSREIAQPLTKDEYFQARPSAASYDASASAASSLAASNNFSHRQNRDLGVPETPLLQRPAQRVCRFYDC